MSITITLYKMTDDPRKITKTLPSATGTFLTFATSWLKDVFMCLDPELTLASTDDLSTYNYMQVGAPVNRYYFIKPTILKTGLWKLNAREDVLMVFGSAIRSQAGIVSRSSNRYNTYLSDNIFESLCYRRIQTIPFEYVPFTNQNNGFYLTVTGGDPGGS